tara:strand:- start:548 stop:1441 length:894 start_codon:yes stop_codon:yes gene_type:complete
MRSIASYIRILLFASISFYFLNWIGSAEDTSIFIQQPWLWSIWGALIFFHMACEICIAAISRVLYNSMNIDARKKYDSEVALKKVNQFKWIKEYYKTLLGAKALEEESEIILDHNYDGIQELDNDLPPWWKYGFYATIIFASIYLIRFEIFNDYNQTEEYELAVAEAIIEIEDWKKTAKNVIDENSVIILTDASDLNTGKNIYLNNCAVCHKPDGGGGIGPNLTDEYWILGGGIKNIFKTVAEGGRNGKGMIAWKNDLQPLEIAQVASYIMSFQNKISLEPKGPEGEIWKNSETLNP